MNTEMRRHLVTPLMRGLLVCWLGSYALTAAAANEVEPNDSISSAQPVAVPAEGLTISARIGTVDGDLTTDVDFFKFEAAGGDTLSISIVGAQRPDGNGACDGFPSNLALYDVAGGSPLFYGNIAECETGTEPRIVNATVPGEGRHTYIVGVSAWTHTFLDDGDVDSSDMDTPGGTYQLVINGVTPPATTPPTTPPSAVKHVPIAIRHWHHDERDLGKRNGRDPITVVIMSTKGFDATQVDPNSLTFGSKGDEKSLFRCRKDGIDINHDRRMDTVCYFKPDVASFKPGDLNGVLKGKTKSGQQIDGTGALRIFSLPPHRRGFKHHDFRRKNRNNHH